MLNILTKLHFNIILTAIIACMIVAEPAQAQQANNLTKPDKEVNNQPLDSESLQKEEHEKNINALKSIYDDEELIELTTPNEEETVDKPIDENAAQSPPDNETPSLENAPLEIKPETNLPPEPKVQPVQVPTAQPENNAPSTAEPNIAPADKSKTTQPSPLTRNNRRFEPSFTDYNYSMFFAPNDFNKYLNIIRKTEEDVFMKGTLNIEIEDIDDELLEKEVELEEPEPIVFPYFQLISIIYHSPKQWAVMTNGLVLSNDKNDATKELYVASITPTSVRLVWKPQDYRLFEATNNNHKLPEKYNQKEHFNKIKHRQIKGAANMVFDDKLGTISFTLQPNQLFFSEYVNVYEGNPKDILPPPPPPPPEEIAKDSAKDSAKDAEIIPEGAEPMTTIAPPNLENLPPMPNIPDIPAALKPVQDVQNEMNKNLRDLTGKAKQ